MIILTGASASGKTEVAKALRRMFGVVKVITHTTRQIRPTEIADVDYHFVDETTFLQLEHDANFVETTLYNGNHYGTSKKEIADNKVLIVDPRGLKAFKDLHNPHIVAFFLEAAPAEREKRMILRGDAPDKIASRLVNDLTDFADEKVQIADYRIGTDDKNIEQVATAVFELYQKHLQALSA